MFGDFREGVKIEWTSTKGSHPLVKKGIFIEVTHKTIPGKRTVCGTHAKVHLNGNKHPSIVPIKELRRV